MPGILSLDHTHLDCTALQVSNRANWVKLVGLTFPLVINATTSIKILHASCSYDCRARVVKSTMRESKTRPQRSD
jgi:hypothetical protein